MLQTLYPVNIKGLIDEELLFKLAYGDLKLPLNSLDFLTIKELGWLVENHIESKKEHYELISFAFRVGYINAKTGKNHEMFAKDIDLTGNKNKISLENREKELKKIEELMR